MQTGMSRAFLPAIPIFLPGVVGSAMMAVSLYPKNAMGQKVLELCLCTFALTVGLPASISLFKSQASLTR